MLERLCDYCVTFWVRFGMSLKNSRGFRIGELKVQIVITDYNVHVFVGNVAMAEYGILFSY